MEGLRAQAQVGVPLKERERRQRILIDLELGLNLKPAGERDRVQATINYAAVAKEVKDLVEGGSFHLVEAMAEAVGKLVLERFKPTQVRVRIRKFSVPGTSSVGVEIVRPTSSGNSRKRSTSPRVGPR